MTLVRLGYVAMSKILTNCSPSQTMTYANFAKMNDEDAARKKLEHKAQANLDNCLRLLKHNLAHDVVFFRLSSRLVPLATHEALDGWDYMNPIKDRLTQIGQFAEEHSMRIDFHPDHFVVLNSPKAEVMKSSIKTLHFHRQLLKGMNINPAHRCVLHVGGRYGDKEKALEQFIANWGHIPHAIQQMIMLENDDKSFNVQDTLYLCEKLGIPLVFDYHHHLANHEDADWQTHWSRIIETWTKATLPIKMHISSPKSEKRFRDHADYIDIDMFLHFLKEINGSAPQIDCMIEAKNKDDALFQLVQELKERSDIEMVDEASFHLK